MSEIITRILKSEFWRWLKRVFGHGIGRIGCSGIAAFQGLYGVFQRESPPVITWIVLFFCFFAAAFLAWRDEIRKANKEHDEAVLLREQAQPRLEVWYSDDEQCKLMPVGSAGGLFYVSGLNTKTSAQYIQFHNATSAPSDTAVARLQAP